jgi:ABC-type transport system involved in Fe-S cluster assembly fused permease/ATPase subunit
MNAEHTSPPINLHLDEPEPTSTTRRVGKHAVTAAISYMLAQLLTGVELGIVAAMFVLVHGWELTGALAVVLPLGLPLVLLQATLLGGASMAGGDQ